RTDPMGIPPSARPCLASRIAASRNGSTSVPPFLKNPPRRHEDTKNHETRLHQSNTSPKRRSASAPNNWCCESLVLVSAGLLRPHKKRAACRGFPRADGYWARMFWKSATSRSAGRGGSFRSGGSFCAWPIRQCVQWRSEEHTSELQSRFDLVCR